MALTLPTHDQVYAFWGDEANTADPARTDFFIQMAGDLVWINTLLDADPSDARELRFVQYAIMDMSIYLMAAREDITEDYSPFSGETIGSYNYSKNFRALASQGNTGIYFFDLLVRNILLGVWATQGLSCSEDVLAPGYRRHVRSERLLHPDDRFVSGPSDGNLLSDFNSTLGADPANVGFPFGGDG